MKSALRIDAAFEVVVAFALVLLIAGGIEMPIPGQSGSLAILAIIFLIAAMALWLLSSRASKRLVAFVAMANLVGGIAVTGWLSLELSHLQPAGAALVIVVAIGFFVIATIEFVELRHVHRG